MDRKEVLQCLREHETDFEDERAFLAQTIDFVERTERFWQRSTLEGHLTGSAWVISANADAVLLLHHAKLDRWLQPGGHVDEMDASLQKTAERVALEECGMKTLTLVSPMIFDLDVHEIPARNQEPAHLHYDLRFLFKLEKDQEMKRNLLETNDLAWVSVPSLCLNNTPRSIQRMALKTLKFDWYKERF